MPIIFNVKEAYNFLDSTKVDFLSNGFISEVESELDFYNVQTFVNNPINNSIKCIKAVN